MHVVSEKNSLNESELRACIQEWLDGTPPADSIFEYEIGDFNGPQTGGQAVSRLYYAVPKCSPDGAVSDFLIFYEENTLPDDEEDFLPVHSRFFLWQAEDKTPEPCKY